MTTETCPTVQAWEDAGRPHPYATFRAGYDVAVANFLETAGQYVTNDASRKAAIKEAVELDRQQRGYDPMSGGQPCRSQPERATGKDPGLDWIDGVHVTETMGRGWCVRIDGTDIFEGRNQYGCKGRRTFQVAASLPNREAAEKVAHDWLVAQLARFSQPAEPVVKQSLAGEQEAFEEHFRPKGFTFKREPSGHYRSGYGAELWTGWQARASLAQPTTQQSLQVEPVEWQDAQRIADLPEVDELSQGFADDPTGDNGTLVVQTVMQATRRSAELVRDEPTDEELFDFHEKFRAERSGTDNVFGGYKRGVIAHSRALLARYQSAQLARIQTIKCPECMGGTTVDVDGDTGGQKFFECARCEGTGFLTIVSAQDEGMVSVNKQDANDYCRILKILGMEEEGDPVAGVERLVAAQPNAPGLIENLSTMCRRLILDVRALADEEGPEAARLSRANQALKWLQSRGLAGSPLRDVPSAPAGEHPDTQAIRDAALEEAAVACHQRESRGDTRQAQAACRLCEKDIRALKSQPGASAQSQEAR